MYHEVTCGWSGLYNTGRVRCVSKGTHSLRVTLADMGIQIATNGSRRSLELTMMDTTVRGQEFHHSCRTVVALGHRDRE